MSRVRTFTPYGIDWEDVYTYLKDVEARYGVRVVLELRPAPAGHYPREHWVVEAYLPSSFHQLEYDVQGGECVAKEVERPQELAWCAWDALYQLDLRLQRAHLPF